MSLYLHIPFCKQACSYCDFHFTVNHERRDELVGAMVKELELRKDWFGIDHPRPALNSIYLGGGTPSVLDDKHLLQLFEKIDELFDVTPDAEITLEANPDDLTKNYLLMLRRLPVNRLSIGVQSFRESDLKLMNRAHDSPTAVTSILNAADAGFENLTIDLIYGIPEQTIDDWKTNLEKAFSLPVNHLSCYNLTVEQKTLLYKQVHNNLIKMPDDQLTADQFLLLMDMAEEKGFIHYEISNFGKPGYFSQHNSSYWKNLPYLGIGPSAHSYNGQIRQWNVAQNANYITSIARGEIPATAEHLSAENRYNEYIMTGLRTMWGVNESYIREHFGNKQAIHFLSGIKKLVETDMAIETKTGFTLSRKGKLLADRLASDLFI
jgi:oxygen-independent coproporphyrinogen III oxidase